MKSTTRFTFGAISAAAVVLLLAFGGVFYHEDVNNYLLQQSGKSTASNIDSAAMNGLSNYFCSRLANWVNPSQLAVRDVSLDLPTGKTEFKMFYYNNSDIVSHSIASTGSWEPNILTSIVERLEEYRKKHNLERHQVTFVDIGANIGWFSTAIAYIGYRVISFEPMPLNEIILRKNQCLFRATNPKNEWIYFNKGLSDKPGTCRIVSDRGNVGNGVLDCAEIPFVLPNHEVRATIDVQSVDDLIPEAMLRSLNLAVIKMDVENHEKFVILGGNRLFSSECAVLFMEYQTYGEEHLQRSEFVKGFFDSLGYRSAYSFRGDEINLKIGGLIDTVAWNPKCH